MEAVSLAVVAISLFMICFDVSYFVRGFLCYVYHSFIRKTRRTLFQESYFDGICLPTDIDFLLHMNNARYLRECDFARLKLWIENGVEKTCKALGGAIVLGCSSIRYRKSIHLFDRFTIESKVLGWDEKAFYVEQHIKRRADGFIFAVVFIKQNIINISPERIIHHIRGQVVDSPDLPLEFQKWIESQEISSQRLRRNS